MQPLSDKFEEHRLHLAKEKGIFHQHNAFACRKSAIVMAAIWISAIFALFRYVAKPKEVARL